MRAICVAVVGVVVATVTAPNAQQPGVRSFLDPVPDSQIESEGQADRAFCLDPGLYVLVGQVLSRMGLVSVRALEGPGPAEMASLHMFDSDESDRRWMPFEVARTACFQMRATGMRARVYRLFIRIEREGW